MVVRLLSAAWHYVEQTSSVATGKVHQFTSCVSIDKLAAIARFVSYSNINPPAFLPSVLFHDCLSLLTIVQSILFLSTVLLSFLHEPARV